MSEAPLENKEVLLADLSEYDEALLLLGKVFKLQRDGTASDTERKHFDKKVKDVTRSMKGIDYLREQIAAGKIDLTSGSVLDLIESVLPALAEGSLSQINLEALKSFLLLDYKPNTKEWALGLIANLEKQEPVDDDVKDRLLANLELDEERERAYEKMQARWMELDLKGDFASSFCDLFNQFAEPKRKLDPARYPTLRLDCDSPELTGLRKQLGHDFVRPVVRMNLADFQRFYEDLTGVVGSAGCNIHVGEVSIIVSSGNYSETEHELRHSVDPNIDKRSGGGKVIEEFAAFYGDIINPKYRVQRTRHNDGPWEEKRTKIDLTPRYIGLTLKTPMYHQQCWPEATEEDYFATVDRVVTILEKLMEKYDVNQVNLALFNATTIVELESLLN